MIPVYTGEILPSYTMFFPTKKVLIRGFAGGIDLGNPRKDN